jgi:hypothetical protein
LNFITVPQQISWWGNDVHADCVTAEEAFAKACNNPEIFISDNEVISWATSHGVLENADLLKVMQWMQNDGFCQDRSIYNDGACHWVDCTVPETLRSAISKGPVKIGVAANQISAVWNSTDGHTGWFCTGFHYDDSQVDHCVSLCGYGTLSWLAQQLQVQVPSGIDRTQQGYAMFTWNSIAIIDEPSMVAITHEAWLRQPTTVISSARPSANLSIHIGKFAGNPSGNLSIQIVPPPPPPPVPVPPALPTAITLSSTNVSISNNSRAGRVIATASVTMCDGSQFKGTLTSSDTSGIFAISGMNVVTGRALTAADDGLHTTTITAMQNGP